jgi:methanogenic corrinoid protein MtbC1
MDANLSTPEIDEKVIAPALWLVGELWERGTISVAEEHIATEISVRVLALQREAQRVARSRSERRVMIAAPAGELGAIDEVRQARPSAGFVVGGRGVTVEGQLRPQVHICERVSDAVEAVDAMVQRAGLN